MAKVIQLKDITKSYFVGKPNELEVLHGISLDIEEGEFVAIVGESGSGKSTLMNIIGVLDQPTTGEYVLDDTNVDAFSENEKAAIRNNKIGFVFQNFNLINRSNVLKNVELPMVYAKVSTQERKRRALELLEKVNMADRVDHLPPELSGGQKQRVSIARALANSPSMILADEPTGALDSQTSKQVMDIFHSLNKNDNTTIILITHSKEIAAQCQRVVTIKDGVIIQDVKGEEYER